MNDMNKLEDQLRHREPNARPLRVSFEFFPPKTPQATESLWQTIRRLEPLRPHFVSVTYGAGGSTREKTREIVKRIAKETSLKPASHLTCVAETRENVDAVIRDYWASGIRHIVALRGDPPGDAGGRFVPHPGGYTSSIELVTAIKRIAPFEVSVGCYPELHPDATSYEADIEFLKRKVDAGADRCITQFFYGEEVFLRFLERARKAGIKMPIVPGIMPISNFKNVCRFAKVAGATVPDWLHQLCDGLDDDPDTLRFVASVVVTQQCDALRRAGVEQFHFYTMNRPELTYAVCHMLDIRPVPVEAPAPVAA
jgi:methylenetetrahydrofolate reductase (NADPH)